MGPEDERRVGRLPPPRDVSLDEHLEHSAGSIIFGHLWTDVLEIAGEGFDSDIFSQEASRVWHEYVPHQGFLEVTRPTSQELENLSWSYLVPEELRGERLIGLIKSAWDIWEDFKKGQIDLHPYVAVAGTLGTGKSVFGRALHGARPLRCKLFSELWEDNQDLMLFYDLLTVYTRPGVQQSFHFGQLEKLLHSVQGSVQGYFGSIKFPQMLMGLSDLKEYEVVQDVSLQQDGVYFGTQAQLGLASPENVAAYKSDNRLRQRLLPPYLKAPILVYIWAPFEVVRYRVLEERGRDFEQKVPPGYLKALQLNTIQWMSAMRQAGVPVIVVDAEKSDVRPGKPDRPAVVDLVWAEIEKAHQELWGRDNNSGWA